MLLLCKIMESHFATESTSMRILLIVSLLAGLLVGGCGYKGSLYLPKASGPAAASAAK